MVIMKTFRERLDKTVYRYWPTTAREHEVRQSDYQAR